jgi:hypothetical protein
MYSSAPTRPKNQPHRNREPPTCGVMHDVRSEKLILLAASLEFAPIRREHVFYSFRLAAIRERDDEPIGCSKHVYGCAVDLSRFATDVRETAAARNPACK